MEGQGARWDGAESLGEAVVEHTAQIEGARSAGRWGERESCERARGALEVDFSSNSRLNEAVACQLSLDDYWAAACRSASPVDVQPSTLKLVLSCQRPPSSQLALPSQA